MGIESELKKDGIEVIKRLDTLKINSLARNISMKMNYLLNYLGLICI